MSRTSVSAPRVPCQFCGREFHNAQAVRAHLQWCPAYNGTAALEPEPGAAQPRAARGTAQPGAGPGATQPAAQPRAGFRRARQVRQEVEAEVASLELRQVKQAHAELDAEEADRKRQEREARAAEIAARKAEAAAREEARARAKAEEAERRRREELEDAARRRRQEIAAERRRRVQWGKDRAIASGPYAIPAALKASALVAIERELSALPLDELEWREILTIAEGVRDRIYAPHVEAEKRAAEEQRAAKKRESEAAWDKTRRELETWSQKQGLLRHGLEYADREMRGEDMLDIYRVRPIVQGVLERKLTGRESEGDVEDLVEDVLERELG